MEHNLGIGASKPIDRLVVIAHNKQIVLRLCEKPYHLILQRTDVLKFIHKDIAEAFLPHFKDFRPGYQKVAAQQNHVVEINQPFVIHLLFICMIYMLKFCL